MNTEKVASWVSTRLLGWTVIIVLISVLSMLVAQWTAGGLKVFAVTEFAGVLIVVIYAIGMYRAGQKYKAQTGHIETQNVWIPSDEFESKIHPRLRQNVTMVYLAMRRHWLRVAAELAPLVVLVFLCPPAAVFVAVQGQPPEFGRDVAWIILLVAMCSMVACYVRWISWRCSYLIVTDRAVIIMRSMPPFLWWMSSDAVEMSLDKIETANHKDTASGNWFGYGIVTIDSAASEDTEFHGMKFVPAHEQVVGIIKDAVA